MAFSESWAVVIGARLREFAVVADDDGKRMDCERPKRARWSEATGVATVTSNPSHTPKKLRCEVQEIVKAAYRMSSACTPQ